MAEGATAQPAGRLQELSQIIRAYNQVTENLQRSHESLTQQVARLQQQLASKDAQLQRSKRLAALGEMAAGIAHEVRNPLAAIQLYAQMIEQDATGEGASGQEPGAGGAEPTGEKPAAGAGSMPAACPLTFGPVAENARKIAAVVRGLDAIVRDVLVFAREVTPRRQPTEVAALWQRVLASHRPACEAAQVSVEQRLGRGAEVIEVDGDLMQQALLNLVRNAVDAMVEGAPAGRRVLGLGARRQGDQVILSVRDSGPGIAQADIDRIFNPFFTTRRSGTGLGLAIVHRIVDAHGGTIAVHNDGGAVFEVGLPQPRPSRARPMAAARTAASGVRA